MLIDLHSTSTLSHPRPPADPLQRVPFAFIECDATHRVRSWNDHAAKLFGYSPEEAMGQELAALIPPVDELRGWTRLLDGGGDERQTWTHARKGGGTVVCDWSRQPSLDEARKALCLFGHDVTRLATEAEEGRANGELLRAIHDRLPMVVWRTDAKGVFTYYEGEALARAGLTPGQHVGVNIFELHPPEVVGYVHRALAGEAVTHRNEGFDMAWENWVIPFRTATGEIAGVLGFSIDVTELHRAERDLGSKIELIELQQKAIRDLSTPILQVWAGVLTLPMIGIVDSARTAAVMDDLLAAVARTQARFAILDLTGVEAVDTHTAAYLLELIRAIRLLGAEGIITGIRPSVAQTIVGLGVDLGGILTLGNLQAGLRHCIAAMQRAAARSTR